MADELDALADLGDDPPGKWIEFEADGLTVKNLVLASADFIASQPGDFVEAPDGIVVSPGDSYDRDTGIVKHRGSIEPDAPLTEENRSRAADVIDARTEALIARGFEYPPGSGHRFSLSSVGQRNLIGSYLFKDSPYFVYPVRWATLNDDQVIYLQDAAELMGFCLTALGTVRAHRDSGSALKERVVQAQTGADLALVIDTR